MKIKNSEFLSHPITENSPLYAGVKGIRLRKKQSMDKKGHCNSMYFSFPNHVSTHIDAPLHFVKKGLSITDFPASAWVFKTTSLIKINNITPGYVIKEQDIRRIGNCELLLIKTGFEIYRGEELYWENSPCLDAGLSVVLKKLCPSLRAVGVDFISISNMNNRKAGRLAHRAFLEKNILLIEDMRLSSIKKIPDLVIALPLLVNKADASPCTAIGIYN